MSDELSDDELLRYHRQINLRGVDIDGQAQLKRARVLIIGLGGLGCAAAQYLAVAGVGRLTLVDPDRVETSNLQRQVLHDDSRLGQAKVDSAAESLARLNPWLQLQTHAVAADEAGLACWLPEHDLVLDCSDNLPTRNLLNCLCRAHRVPLVSGAAIRFEGQVSLFRWGEGEPCYACLSSLFGDQGQSCVEAGVLAPLVGLVGSLQAMEAIKLWLDIGTPLSGQLLLIDGLSGEFRSLRLSRRHDCPVCAQQREVTTS